MGSTVKPFRWNCLTSCVNISGAQPFQAIHGDRYKNNKQNCALYLSVNRNGKFIGASSTCQLASNFLATRHMSRTAGKQAPSCSSKRKGCCTVLTLPNLRFQEPGLNWKSILLAALEVFNCLFPLPGTLFWVLKCWNFLWLREKSIKCDKYASSSIY